MIKHTKTLQTRNHRRRIFCALLCFCNPQYQPHPHMLGDWQLTFLPAHRSEELGCLDEPIRIPEPRREHIWPTNTILCPRSCFDIARILELLDLELAYP